MRKDFGSSSYAIKTVTGDARMAKVKKKAGAKLLKSASNRARLIKKLKRNTAVRVLSEGKTWTKVSYAGKTGYVRRSLLKFYTEKVTDTTYVKVTPTPTPTPSPTPTPTPTPSPSPVVSLPTQPSDETLVAASVRRAVALADGTPVYAEMDASTLQATVPAGSAFDVVGDENGWVAVLLGDATRYVRAESVEFVDDASREEEVFLEAMGDELIFGTEAVDVPDEETGDGLEIEAETAPEAAFDIEIDEDGSEISED